MRSKLTLSLLSLLLFGCLSTFALSGPAVEPAAPKSPMGWNSWNHFGHHVTDQTIRDTADAMVASGMRDAGYLYVNIDDKWEGTRDAEGHIHPNEKFPDMKALADYVHSKGLKLGIYSSPGAKICAGFEGSLGHEEIDAQDYAKWGIDYLKYDLCSYTKELREQAGTDSERSAAVMQEVYLKMHNALAATGRPIVLSMCQYGWTAVWRWGAKAGGNLWRTTGDIQDNYPSMANIGFSQVGLSPFAGPDHWNDPDMLEVGNGGMKPMEYRTHMSLWAMLAAPLLAGNDLSAMTDETKSILLSKEVIAIDQDKAGHQGDRVMAEGPVVEVWMKPLADGSKAIAIFNRWTMPLTLDVSIAKFGFRNAPVSLHDVWEHQDLPAASGTYHAAVPPHGVVMLRATQR